jgi:hypothetical protein
MLLLMAYRRDLAISSGLNDLPLLPFRHTLPKEEAMVDDFRPIFE